ncbi:MAG TPA: aminotransferase class IV [Gemmatimonadales bacterium]|nr:aminotransferase class IV [Gemmatimonadales bacterium]
MSATAGLIETVRVRDGVAPLWGLHLNRLFLSCKALGIPHPRELTVPAGGPDRVHRLLVTARGTEASERAVGAAPAVRLVTARGVVHRPYPHKTTERGQFERAAAEARAAGADDALLVTADGLVAETTVRAVLWWRGGRVAGPPLATGILPSVGRARIAELVGEVVEERLAAGELAAREPFLVNAVEGVTAVATLDGGTVAAGPGLRELQARFWG